MSRNKGAGQNGTHSGWGGCSSELSLSSCFPPSFSVSFSATAELCYLKFNKCFWVNADLNAVARSKTESPPEYPVSPSGNILQNHITALQLGYWHWSTLSIYSDFPFYLFQVCVWWWRVCMYLVLHTFISHVGLYIHHHSEDTKLFHHHHWGCLSLPFYSHTTFPWRGDLH